MNAHTRPLTALTCTIVLAACGGGGDAPAGGAPPANHAIGGAVTGLQAGTSVVLQNNAGNDLTVSAAGSFTFAAPLASGATYAVTVRTQPANQQCSVANGSGAVGAAAVTNVMVTCVATYPIGGSVSGLTGTGLVLQLNGGGDLPVAGNGAFSFATALAGGVAYSVTVRTHPTGQHCSVVSGTGVAGQPAFAAALVQCGPQVAKFLYVPNVASNDISVYAINADSGELTAVAGSPFAAGHAAPSLSAFDPAGKFFYVTGRGSASEPPRISVHSVNATTGGLTAVVTSPFELSHNPPLSNGAVGATFRPLIHPSGAFGYTATVPGDRVFGASVDPATGTLTEIAGMPVAPGLGVGSSAMNSGGTRLYVPHDSVTGVPGSGGAINVYSIATPSGSLTPVGGATATGGQSPTFASLSPDGTMLAVANGASGSVATYLVDATTGALTAAPGSPFSTGNAAFIVTNLVWHPTKSFLYATNSNESPTPSSIAAFQVNASNAALTPVAGSPFATQGEVALIGSIERTGSFFFVSHRATDTIAVLAIDQTTGALTHVGGSPFATLDAPVGVTLDPSGRYLYAANNGSGNVTAYRVHPATGALTVINTAGAGTQPSFATTFGLQ